jgi:hypothetical protein
MKKIAFLVLTLTLLWTGCTPDGIDTEAPIILEGNIVPMPITGTICGSTQNNVIYARSGDSIRFGLTVRDNDLLSQYQLDIQDNFDCNSSRSNTTTWSLQKVVDILSAEYQVQEVIGVPLDVTAGNYSCSFSAVDAAGNPSDETITYMLSILNSADTIPPTLNVTSSLALNATNGDTITIAGTLDDNEVLNGGRMEFLFTDANGNENSIETINLDTTVTMNSYPFSFDYIIPSNWAKRTYEMEVIGFDAVGNAATAAEVEVTIQ